MNIIRQKSLLKKCACRYGRNKQSRFLRPGFTLWELMVAATIAAIAIGGLFAAFSGSISLSEANNNLITAATDAQCVLEEISALPFNDIDSYSVPAFSNLENENVVVSVSSVGTNIKEVTVDVSWTHKQRPGSFRLSTRFAR